MALFALLLSFCLVIANASHEESSTIVILGTRIESNPAGRAIGHVKRQDIEKTDSFSLKELMDSVPGVFVKQSNGPRDVSISVRGSGAKTGFGVRNVKMYEDWFPVTQSDGLSRTDLHDPSAYEGVDVLRGPSSALYDNYALGGVVNFRSRKGRDLQGWDAGTAGGSFGYQNHYVHMGRQAQFFEYGAFASLIRGDGFIRHSGYTTTTQNLTMTFTPDDKRTVLFKFLNNDLKAQVPSRLTQDEFDSDSRSAGRATVTGVGTVAAERAAQTREDRRTLFGARYEHSVSPETGWRLMGLYDVKDINQTFGTIGDNVNTNFQQYADLTHEWELLGRPAKHFGGVFFNYMEQEAATFRNLADGEGTRGGLQSNSRGYHRNIGARLREEWEFAPSWTAVAGLGAEQSKVKADVQTLLGTASRVKVDRGFFNAAPELAVVWKRSKELSARARAAMGYGIPGISQLTTDPSGAAGNNAALKPQRNLGFELGAGGKRGWLSFDAVGFYEFFYNELVTQSPGAGLSNFTSNAPRSEHRGVELWSDLRLPAGPFLSAAYTFNDQVYRAFQETLGPGDVRDRTGRAIPGVEPHMVNARLGYERAQLPGGWVELNHVSSFWINNSNTLRTRPYAVFNVNLNYTRKLSGAVKRASLYFDIRNLLDLAYQGSAVTVADAAADTPATLVTGKQAFFAGQGRSFSGGVRLHF